MPFYEENIDRAARLQQLVDSSVNLQGDVIKFGDDMDKASTDLRPAINKLLEANGMSSMEDVINNAKKQLNDEEKRQFEALIELTRLAKKGEDWIYLIGTVLMAPEGVILTGRLIIGIGRWGARMANVTGISDFFKATKAGDAAAAAAAETLAKEAGESEKLLADVGEVGEAGEDISGALKAASRIGSFCEALGAVGLIVTAVAFVIQMVVGHEQMVKLIDAIHQLQPSRLVTAYFKAEGNNIFQRMDTLKEYLKYSPGGATPNPIVAQALASDIVTGIAEDNQKIDLAALEADLEKQDKQSGNFYGKDDLSTQEVIDRANGKIQ